MLIGGFKYAFLQQLSCCKTFIGAGVWLFIFTDCMRNCVGKLLSSNCLCLVVNNLDITRMTKQQLTQLAGSQAELARLLNISRSAVCQWVAVPELQLRRLKDLRPQWFTA
jgi:hypothetical protein